jgi:hypothetical protein
MAFISLLALLPFCLNMTRDISYSCTGEIKIDTVYEERVHPTYPIYQFHLVAYYSDCYKLYILNLKANQQIQIIEDQTQTDFFEDNKYEFKKAIEFIDINFDGYLDIKVFEAENQFNISYRLWIFDPNLNKFIFDEPLTRLVGGNLNIDVDSKTIKTGGTGGCVGMCYEWDTYQFNSKKLILIEREKQERFDTPDNGSYTFVRTLEKLIDGKLKIVKKVSGSIDQVDTEWDNQ